jgi:gliding motility-associated-like protein
MNNPIPLINTSVIAGGEPLNYSWSFSDGTTDSVANSIKTFTILGNASIKLVVISSHGCEDSMQRNLTLLPNGIPDFAWDSVCTGRGTHFTNLTNENGTALARYHWDFKNGFVSDTKTPNTFIYDNAGLYYVSLKVVNLGCENAPQTIVKPVQVGNTTPNKRYKDLRVVEGSVTQLFARDSIGNHYSWQPGTDLSDNQIRDPLYTAAFEVMYLVTISDDHTCYTTDTLTIHVMKKAGVYMPTAFTPNGDGKNDVIKPIMVGMQGLKKFTIFNRYGNMIFSTSKEDTGWDGTYQGSRMESGVFVWMVQYIGSDGAEHIEKGTLTLIR